MKTYLDLFGGETAVAEPFSVVSYDFVKRKMHYRKAEGPDQCGNCGAHSVYRASRRYHKCTLLGDTRSEATDIGQSYVCDKYTPIGKEEL